MMLQHKYLQEIALLPQSKHLRLKFSLLRSKLLFSAVQLQYRFVVVVKKNNLQKNVVFCL